MATTASFANVQHYQGFPFFRFALYGGHYNAIMPNLQN